MLSYEVRFGPRSTNRKHKGENQVVFQRSDDELDWISSPVIERQQEAVVSRFNQAELRSCVKVDRGGRPGP